MSKLKTNFRSAEESPGFLLWKAANLLQRSHADALKTIRLTPAQFSLMTCLVYLSQHKPTTSSLISKHSGMDKMMVSDLIKTLLNKGLITTTLNSTDRRSFLIMPTKRGVKITNEAIGIIEELDEVFFQRLKARSSFMEALQRLIG